jgi:putative spermidine/putrescine transport system substrate-binding protein
VAAGELTVMSWAGRWGRSLDEAVSKPFTEETGIRVHHRINIGLKLPAELTGALEQGQRPPMDVVWCNGVPAMRAARSGWCQALDGSEGEDGGGGDRDGDGTGDQLAARLSELHPRARPDGIAGGAGSAWKVVLPYVVQYVLVYRREIYPHGPPTSWDVLLEPRFREKLALYPGGNGFYPIAQVLGGGQVADIPGPMEACWRYLRTLKPQIGTLDYSIQMAQLLADRRLDLCFRALTNALGFREEGQDVGWAAPREGITDTLDALWIPRGIPADSAAAARRYIAYALSAPVQERWCGRMGVLPVHPKAALPSVFRDDRTLPQSADDLSRVLHVPEGVKAVHEGAWEAKFNEVMKA